MDKKEYFHTLKGKFLKGFRWSFIGSIVFQTSYILHNALLLTFLGASFYGLLGSLFSIVYLVINITDFGFESSFTPFLHIISRNKKTFKKIFPIYVLPQIAIFALGSLVAMFFYSSLFTHHSQNLPPAFFTFLITLEGIRIFFRRFLHNVFFNKATVIIEQSLMAMYYAAVWLPYFLFSRPLTINSIFIPYLINSIIALILFTIIIIWHYQTLPSGESYPAPSAPDASDPVVPGLWRRILRTRYFNYLINIETFLISGNFLVPFFATTFGLHQAGLFKIANIVAHSIKALVKAAIHFPGTALLASVKTKSLEVKKAAFYTLSSKLNHIIIFIILFLSINYHTFAMFYQTSKSAWAYASIFIGITIVHQLFVVYEQFYIIEEFVGKLFIIKSIEFILFYLLIIANTQITPLAALINIGLIQLLCFSILAIHAYARWKIKPYFKVTPSFIVVTTLISLAFFFTSRLLISP